MCAMTTTSTGLTDPPSDPVGWYLSECKHNHFNHSRVKKGKAWLCCRDCGTKWRTPHPLHSLCPEFYETRGFCSLGSSCPYLHVHRFKCTERSPTHVDYVGEDRDDLLRECAIAVLAEHLPEQPFPRDVMPQIRALYEARRGEMNIPPANHAHFPAAQMPTPHAIAAHFSVVAMPTANAIPVEGMQDQQGTEVNRIPTPAVAAKMVFGAPAVFPASLGALAAPGVVTSPGLNPIAHPAQQQLFGTGGAKNLPPTAAPLLPVTARYVPIQRGLFEQHSLACGHSLDSESDILDDGTAP